MYHVFVRRIQIHIGEAMDDTLATEARRRGLSKAALIRLLLEERLHTNQEDPIDAVVGAGDGLPADDIDAIVYGR